ncbi:MAG: aspartate aminotransferase-like enzyme [Verrucomicrobiales bacterium]|jgi:aspartate aminotransferase-like enzyme
MDKTHLFTPGPVPIEDHLLAIGAKQPPYNRTEAFSDFTHEILDGLSYLFQTEGSVAILTASGTAAMEASILNFLDFNDQVLIINGGTFGQRWCDLCDVHGISYDEIEVPYGADLDMAHLSDVLLLNAYTAMLVNAHETSMGHLYDIRSMGDLAQRHGVFFVVDAISTICADAFFMDDWHVDVAILSSQKALALPPGLSFVAMNQRAINRADRIKPKSLYLNLADYLANQQRGQLPYTPAIGLMMQLHQRLLDIRQETLSLSIARHQRRADSFRKAMEDLVFDILPARSSNALTALWCKDLDAFEVVRELAEEHHIVVASSGGEMKSKVFRVAHMGAQEDEGVECLVEALRNISTSAMPSHNQTESMTI